MKKTLIWLATAMLLIFSGNTKVLATDHDFRAVQMHEVLVEYKSPMVGLEDVMIATADKYHLDWTFMAAVAGTESSFGRRMPANCINPYGWGIYGDNKICFKSYEDAIEQVGSGLAEKYNTKSVGSIAHTYNTVSTNGWMNHTEYFMNKIKTAEIPVSSIPVTL